MEISPYKTIRYNSRLKNYVQHLPYHNNDDSLLPKGHAPTFLFCAKYFPTSSHFTKNCRHNILLWKFQ